MEMRNLRIILKRIDATSEFAGMTARWLTIVMMVALLVEAIGRYLFNAPTIWAHELCQILWGFFILLGGSYVLRHDAHVNMDLIYRRLPSRKRAIMDSFTYSLFFLFAIAILIYAVPYAWESIIKLERAPTLWSPPIWPLKMMVPIGVCLLLLQGTARYIRSLYIAITGRELV